MAQLPDHIAARRAASRARLYRQRMAALAVLLLALLAGIVVVATAGAGSGAGGGSQRQAAGVGGSQLGAGGSAAAASGQAGSGGQAAARERLNAAIDRGDAEIARLTKLAMPIYCAGSRGRDLSFTFDDGPGVYTHYAVKKLAGAHEQATFFVVGSAINAWPGWLQRELKVGTLGDHTYTHPDLLEMSSAEVESELESNKRLIERQTGQPVDLFRPPYGAQDATVNGIAAKLGLLDIMWSMDSRDSLGANWAGIIKNVESDMRPGAIILMHENRGQTIRALTTLLPVLSRRHLRSVSLPVLFANDPPSVSQVRHGLDACLGHPSSIGELAGAG